MAADNSKIFNLFFVRHGETDFNLEGRFLGISNEPLNEKGISQAKMSAELLHTLHEKFDLILTSPLKRAKETAMNIANSLPYSIEIVEEECLKERNYGKFEGKTQEELMKEFPIEISKYNENKPNTLPPNGELALAVEERVKNLLFKKLLKNYYPYKNIILTTHLNPIRAALIILGLKSREIYYYKFNNASLAMVEFHIMEPLKSRLIHFDLIKK